MSELNAEHRQFIYLAETTRLIRHLAAAAKQAKLKARLDNLPDHNLDTERAEALGYADGALDAWYTALGAALLDDMGQHHYTFAAAAQKGMDWLQDNEDQIQV